ncbi:MAG: hypothetical protein P8N76_26270 [Pirellulaceae bacterium]|nr:hypothetical protein [Pirellulaceae bacterium]
MKAVSTIGQYIPRDYEGQKAVFGSFIVWGNFSEVDDVVVRFLIVDY